MRFAYALFLAVIVGGSSHSAQAAARAPSLVNSPVLRGSPDAMATENRTADRFGLQRFKNLNELLPLEQNGALLPVVSHGRIVLSEDIGEDDKPNAHAYTYARPWVGWFLDDLVNDPTFPKDSVLNVTSLVRTDEYQARLRKHSVTAARGTDPLRRSSHLTGSTFDVTTKPMPENLREWMRRALIDLEKRGLVQATEERYGALCFHVMVFPSYQKGTTPCSAACHVP